MASLLSIFAYSAKARTPLCLRRRRICMHKLDCVHLCVHWFITPECISRSSYSQLQQAQSARLATRSTYAAATPSATLLSFSRLTRSARPVQRCTAIAMAFTK